MTRAFLSRMMQGFFLIKHPKEDQAQGSPPTLEPQQGLGSRGKASAGEVRLNPLFYCPKPAKGGVNLHYEL